MQFRLARTHKQVSRTNVILAFQSNDFENRMHAIMCAIKVSLCFHVSFKGLIEQLNVS